MSPAGSGQWKTLRGQNFFVSFWQSPCRIPPLCWQLAEKRLQPVISRSRRRREISWALHFQSEIPRGVYPERNTGDLSLRSGW